MEQCPKELLVYNPSGTAYGCSSITWAPEAAQRNTAPEYRATYRAALDGIRTDTYLRSLHECACISEARGTVPHMDCNLDKSEVQFVSTNVTRAQELLVDSERAWAAGAAGRQGQLWPGSGQSRGLRRSRCLHTRASGRRCSWPPRPRCSADHLGRVAPTTATLDAGTAVGVCCSPFLPWMQDKTTGLQQFIEPHMCARARLQRQWGPRQGLRGACMQASEVLRGGCLSRLPSPPAAAATQTPRSSRGERRQAAAAGGCAGAAARAGTPAPNGPLPQPAAQAPCRASAARSPATPNNPPTLLTQEPHLLEADRSRPRLPVPAGPGLQGPGLLPNFRGGWACTALVGPAPLG